MSESDCLFCKIVAGEIPTEKIYEDELTIAFLDINPQAPFHALVIPKAHIPTVNDLQEANRELMGQLHLAAKNLAAREGFADQGYRTVINCNTGAGQTVFHIHMHLLGGRPFSWPPG